MPAAILAHRCGPAIGPENSKAAFGRSVRAGATVIELDVFFTCDGFPIVADPATARTTALRPLQSYTRDNLRKLTRVDCAEDLLEVDDVFDLVTAHPRVTALFDIKYYRFDLGGYFCAVPPHIVSLTIHRVLMPAVLRGLAARVGLVTFPGGRELLRAAKGIDIATPTNLMMVFPWDKIRDEWKFVDSITLGWHGVNHWTLLPNSCYGAIVSDARDHDAPVFAGLANRVPQIKWTIEHDFDGVWTDDPALAAACIRRFDVP